MPSNFYSKLSAEPTYMEKSAGPVGKLISGLGKSFLGQYGKTFNDWVTHSVRNTIGYGLKKFPVTKPGGITNLSFDPNTGKLLSYTPVEGHGFRNALGEAYNWLGRTPDRLVNRLRISGRKDLNSVRPGLGKGTQKAFGYASTAGMLGGIAELPTMFTDNPEDNWYYNTVHGANFLNPFYHAYNSWETGNPINVGFKYLTPLGLGFTGAELAAEKIQNGMADAAEQGAQQAITSTADTLGNMGLAERLGFLFSPGSASDKYRSVAMDRLAKTMAQVRGTGDPYTDAAMRDIYKTSL